MSLPSLLLLTGFCYILIIGGMSLLRREGLSGQFAIEAIVITALVSGVTHLIRSPTHPVLLLILLYLITMRVRLLVDVGNFFAQRGQPERAERCYQWGHHLWPDRSSRLVLLVNQGACLLQKGDLDQAIQMFLDVLQKKREGHLGVKYEAAAHYNLGVAYRRKSMDTQATLEFNAVIETWPASEYARRAAKALSHKRQ